MNLLVEKFKQFCEMSLFGVLAPLGDRMGIASSRIRMFFIYITFFSFGSPIFIYLAVAFIMNIRLYIRNRRRNPVWDF
ncbi:MAG: PspC family transcriptional regulator [Sphingobacteriales bacterium]|nr:MAG: PspC family transcriptional regulator [Sphingobacteriales bacterium]